LLGMIAAIAADDRHQQKATQQVRESNGGHTPIILS
jgi:hypothetical protein